MLNPRFPHTLRIQRPLRDDSGNVVFDDEGNPTYMDVVLNVAVYNERKIPVINNRGDVVTTRESSINFGYRDNGRSTITGQVDVVQLQISTPLLLNTIYDGDILILTDYDRTYKAKVVRKSNTTFGSNIWFNEVKN